MSSDPIPEDELPPRLQFERMVKGPEPHVFSSVRPGPEEDSSSAQDEEVPESAVAPESDASILARFEALKRTLGEDIEPASAAPRPEVEEPPPPSSPEARPDSGVDLGEPEDAAAVEEPGGSFEALQARIREVKRSEKLGSDAAADAPPAVDSDAPGLTYDELEKIKQTEALQRQREAKKAKRKQRHKNRSFWQELPILILVALVVAIIIKTFFFQAFYIPSGSMIPTLEINDRVLVNKLSYRFGAVERGDILVFDSPEAIDIERSFPERFLRSIGEATGITSPETVLIKRVIGLPGESVSVVDKQVYVNGSPIAEPYLPDGTTMRDFDEITVPADHVFMMGDNRNQSRDSRVFGPIPREDIVGRAFVKVWPPGAWGGL